MEKGRTPLVWIHRNALKKASMGATCTEARADHDEVR